MKLKKTLYFLDSVDDFEELGIPKVRTDKYEIFSFNIRTHKFLESRQIDHSIAENWLVEGDRVKIFDQVLNLWNWYTKSSIFDSMEFEGTNIFGVLDTTEFHNLIVNELFNFWLVKRVIEKENPDRIVSTGHFATMIRSIAPNIEIELRGAGKISHEYVVSWDRFLIRFNIGKIPVSIPISRHTYTKMKSFIESLVSAGLGLNFNLKNKNKTILFLEFNPLQYSETIRYLSRSGKNIVFFNMRRSAVWNHRAAKLLQKYGGRIITHDILDQNDKNRIILLGRNYLDELESVFSHDKVLEEIFSIDKYSFWSSVKEPLKEIYKKRITSYIQLLITARKIIDRCNVSCILSLNTMGETEKAIFDITKDGIPSIMLQHAFTNYIKELTRYDIFDTSVFRDKIALWGNLQKKYLMENRNVPEDRIIVVGSPRHDLFFRVGSVTDEVKKTVVITTQNMETTNVLVDTNTYLRLEKLFREIFSILKKFPDYEVVVKLHPAQDPGNEYLKKMIYDLDSSIIIRQTTPIMDILKSCHAIININSELFPSTTMLEGMILDKPILDIVATDKSYRFDFIIQKAVMTVTYDDDLEKPINDIIVNQEVRRKLSESAKKYALAYLANPGSAAKQLADILGSY